MGIKEKTEQIIKEFGQFDSWEEKYKKLITFGKTLDPVSDHLKLEKFRIKGCQSQVWLCPSFEQGLVKFQADSDALIVKGIIGLLVSVYSGETPDSILSDKGDFLQDIGITNHLSMNRTNGLSSMLKSIRMYAMAYKTME